MDSARQIQILGGFIALVRQPIEEKEKFDFKAALLHLTINFVSHPACGG